MSFLRNYTRLNCDVYAAFRHLKSNDKIEKWLDFEQVENPEKVRILVLQEEAYSKVTWQLEGVSERSIILEFNIMRCGQKTEYCTEIQLITTLSNSGADVLTPDALENECSKQILEKLRYFFNKDWVIQERDLTSSIFMNR